MLRFVTVAALATIFALTQARDYRPIVGVLTVPLLVCVCLIMFLSRLLLELVIVFDARGRGTRRRQLFLCLLCQVARVSWCTGCCYPIRCVPR